MIKEGLESVGPFVIPVFTLVSVGVSKGGSVVTFLDISRVVSYRVVYYVTFPVGEWKSKLNSFCRYGKKGSVTSTR